MPDLPRPVEQVRSRSAIARLQDVVAERGAASVIHAGRRVDVPAAGLSVGREDDNDVVVSSPSASRHHARVVPAAGRWFVADLESTNGTLLNGERLRGEARWLQSGDTIVVGGEVLRFVVEQAAADGGTVPARIPLTGRLTIGRGSGNDVQLPGPAVSGAHAEIVVQDGRVEVVDRGSRSGTRVNGTLVERAVVEPGAEIGVGPYRFVFDGTSFIPRDDTGALRLEAEAISVAIRDKVLLDRLSLSVEPGELVAIVGESGSGKSTLLKLLAGVSTPTAGSIRLSGDPVGSRLAEIGYLPQDEIVHPRLTVLESLRYSARLRLPPDSSEPEIDEAVRAALAAVALEHVAEQRVSRLSGGQRKRVGLATELLSHPGILFLDEPTTGLDVGLERQMMDLFRSLAAIGDHAVVLVTHATHSLDRVDKLCVLGRGGQLCFAGPPTEALEFFGAKAYEDIYVALQERPASEWRADFDRRRAAPEPAPEQATPAGGNRLARFDPRLRALQARVLTARYVTTFLRDRLNLLLLVAQAPVLGITLLLLFKRNLFGPPGVGTPLVATQLVFLLVMITIWLGALDASREIVKERAIFARERAMGVTIGPYLLAKLAVLFTLVLAQALILLGLTAALRPFHEGFGAYLEVFAVLAFAGFAAIGMGLFVSSVAQNEDQATALAPVAMTVQLLVGGGIVTVKSMTWLMAAVSATSFGRWAFEGAGKSLHMNARFLADPSARSNQYGLQFFTLGIGETLGLLAGFTALFLAAIALILARRRPG